MLSLLLRFATTYCLDIAMEYSYLTYVQMESLQAEYSKYKSSHQQGGNSGFCLIKRYPTSDRIDIGTLSQWSEFSKDTAIHNVSLPNVSK
jgi:hypothetical protein